MINYSLARPNLGTPNIKFDFNQITFGYPCGTSNDCTPYSVVLPRGRYKIEAWGSSGTRFADKGNPGLGGYVSGILNLHNQLQIYLYVGTNTKFNYMKEDGTQYAKGGASSDVRLKANSNFDWYDAMSLRSRIMVAAGGGSTEWPNSIGGNAGGLKGTDGKSDCNLNPSIPYCPEIITTGGNQTSGGYASKSNTFQPGTEEEYTTTGHDGDFGLIYLPRSGLGLGGLGGNGYYSGASLEHAGAGAGGSSFISGHPGCVALENENSNKASISGSNVHYSGYRFTDTKMIDGNKTMPLYDSPFSEGIGNGSTGRIRITILNSSIKCSCVYNSYFRFILFIPNLIFLVLISD